jgi:hypothetical protein
MVKFRLGLQSNGGGRQQWQMRLPVCGPRALLGPRSSGPQGGTGLVFGEGALWSGVSVSPPWWLQVFLSLEGGERVM